MLAPRRRMWTGGQPVPGYDVRDRQLVVNEAEAGRRNSRARSHVPGSRIAAGKLAQFVVEQLRSIGRDPALVEATIAAEREARGRVGPSSSQTAAP